MDEERRSYLPPETDGPSSDLSKTLADVLRHEEEKVRLRTEVSGPWGVRHQKPLLALLLIFSLSSAFLWVLSPGWNSAKTLPHLSPELASAGLRMEVFLQAVRVRDFRAREGRLPNSLEEAGDPYSMVRYERLDAGRFRLELDGPQEILVYESGQAPGEFLGNALEIIEEAP